MYTIKHFLVFLLLFVVGMSCKKDQYYLYNDVGRIQFGPPPDRIYQVGYDMMDTVKPYTFFYESQTVSQDTVFFDIYTIGGTRNEQRPFKLEQELLPNEENAVAGTHYKAFSDPVMQARYVIKAGQVHMQVPIVLIRDASLKSKLVKLQIRVVANDQFHQGESRKLWRRIDFTDMLSQPAAWNVSTSQYYWGKYSRVKHTFMVEQTGERWDQAFFNGFSTDLAFVAYWRLKLKTLLIDYNKAHPGQPLTDEVGDLVVFP